MAIDIPGLSLSILRQQTRVQAGLPLLISGRFTALGMGVPTFIRVFLEGPSYDPQLRSFDTFTSPFSGDYSINVIAEKDGRYNVYAQAFPPPLIPSGPPFPEAIMLLPPFAESTHPPLVVGIPFDGGVEALLPDGTRERLTAPPMQPIEFRPIITIGAPVITFPPGLPPMIPFAPPPAPPLAPPPVPPAPPVEPPAPPPAPPAPPPEVLTQDILAQPSLNLPRQINVGDTWLGSVSLPTFGTVPHFVEAQLVMIDPSGYEYVAGRAGRTLSPWETLQIPVNLDTAGFSAGNYGLFLMVFDSFGQYVTHFPMGYLTMIEALVPEVPVPEVPVPEIPVPEVPEELKWPTAEMFGMASHNLPSQVLHGDIWSGSISIPTQWPATLPRPRELPSYLVTPRVELEAIILGERVRYHVGDYSVTFSPGQPINLTVNYNTTPLTPDTVYEIKLSWVAPGTFWSMGRSIGSLAVSPRVPEIPPPPLAVPYSIDTYGPAWVLTHQEWLDAGFSGNRYEGTYEQWKYAFELAHPGLSFESYVISNIGFDPGYEWWAKWGRY